MGEPFEYIRQAQTLADCLHRALYIYGDNQSFGTKNDDGTWRWETYSESLAEAAFIANGLRQVGIRKRQVVGICGKNSSAWLKSDFACTFNDYITVGVHTSLSSDKLQFIINNTDMSCLLIDYAKLSDVKDILSKCKTTVTHIVVMAKQQLTDAEKSCGNLQIFSFFDFADSNHKTLTGAGVGEPRTCGICITIEDDGTESATLVAEEELSMNEEECCTLMFTSGTSGTPKGVLTTKGQWKQNSFSAPFAGQSHPVTVVSHMALAHGGDRGLCWQASFSGVRVAFHASGTHNDLISDIAQVKPTILLAMSHFWNRAYNDFEHMLVTEVFETHISKELTNEIKKYLNGVGDASLLNKLLLVARQLPAFNALVEANAQYYGIKDMLLKKARNDWFGGRILAPITGGAPTSAKVIAWMSEVFSPPTTTGSSQASNVKNAYGATEFPGISVNGVIVDEVDVELVDVPEMNYFSTDQPYPRGEIRVRHKNQKLKGYWRNPAATAKVFRDGWYYTGDIGYLTEEKQLFIIDRRTSLIEIYVNGDSQWVESARLEELYCNAPAVENLLLVADRNAPCIIAIVIVDGDYAKDWIKSNPTQSDFHNSSLFQQDILRQLQSIANKHGLKQYEIPAAVIVESECWSKEAGTLNVMGKPVRGTLTIKHKSTMDAIYAELEKVEESEVNANEEAPKLTEEELLVNKHSQQLTAILEAMQKKVDEAIKNKKLLPQTSDCKDFIDFRFNAPSEEHTKKLNSMLDSLVSDVKIIRSDWNTWKQQSIDAEITLNNQVKVLLKNQNSSVQQQVSKVLKLINKLSMDWFRNDKPAFAQFSTPCNQQNTTLKDEQNEIHQEIKHLLYLFAKRQNTVAKQYNAIQANLAAGHAAQAEVLRRYSQSLDSMISFAENIAGVRVPYQISYSAWWKAPGSKDEISEDDPLLQQSLGKAEAWCSITGERIEKDLSEVGRVRYTCLDTKKTGIHRTPEAHLSLVSLRHAIYSLRDMGVPHMQQYTVALDTIDPYKEAIWVLEDRVFWQSRVLIDKTSDKQEMHVRDTPASFILNAFKYFSNRLALGMSAKIPFKHACPLANAATLEPTIHSSYYWLTYNQVEFLSVKIAKGLRSLSGVKQLATVGICSKNCTEWSCTDFGCAIGGLISVGVHSTNSNSTTAHVIRNCGMQVLVCSADMLVPKASSDPTWSVQEVFDACPSLQHVVIMDAAVSDVKDSVASFAPRCTVSSLFEFVDSSNSKVDNITLELPIEQPKRDEDYITILYTSGSSGLPKGVPYPAKSFYNDISERTFDQLLITVSYIPLSHSSDRLKIWEFLGNGGRIAYAYYAASNWLEHEQNKKTEMVQSTNTGTNNVVGLFEQIKQVRPTALACAPRIWNGLYSIYCSNIQAHGYKSPEAAPSHVKQQCKQQLAAWFGDRIQFLITGGAPTAAVVFEFAKDLIPAASFNESYGTTECGAITQNGIPIASKGVQVRLGPIPELNIQGDTVDQAIGTVGEVLVKSPNAAKEYFRNEEQTKKSFVDGWYRTGDVAIRERSNKYQLLGRVSSAIALKSNKPVFPGALEACLSTSPLIKQIFLFVHNSTLISVVVPNYKATVKEVQEEIVTYCNINNRPEHEIPTKIILEQQEWTTTNGLLTAQLKKARKLLLQKYLPLVQS